MRGKLKHLISITAIIMTTSVLLTGCNGGASSSVNSYSDSMMSSGAEINNLNDGMGFEAGYYDEYEESETDTAISESIDESKKGTTQNKEGINLEKLVYSADMVVETMEYDDAVIKINEIIKNNNAIIESKNFYDGGHWDYEDGYKVSGERNLHITVRVPTERFDGFISDVGGAGNIKRMESRVDNISQQYYSSRAYLESYQNQLRELQGMYKRANTIEEMIRVEERIADVEAKILMLTTEIQSMDLDVEYSKVNIDIEEVIKYSEREMPADKRTFASRVWLECKDSWNSLIQFTENIILWFISAVWKIAILILVIMGIKKYVNRHNWKLTRKTKQERKSLKNKLMQQRNVSNNKENKEEHKDK